MKTITAWHFSNGDNLRYGDNRKIVLGETLSIDGPIIPCERGLHASVHALDALMYAPRNTLWRVELSGNIKTHGKPVDKHVASHRKAIAGGKDASEILCQFARECALDVVHLWDAPEVVTEYLKTGDPSLRQKARNASCGSIYASAATYAANAASANAANYAAAYARCAARAAADIGSIGSWEKIKEKQCARFEELCLEFVA